MSYEVKDSGDHKTHIFHEQIGVDDHVFIWLQCDGRPDISIDLMNGHGRRCIDVRADGYGLFGGVVDAQWLDNAGSHKPKRFCSECGGKIDLLSSRAHDCPDPLPSD